MASFSGKLTNHCSLLVSHFKHRDGETEEVTMTEAKMATCLSGALEDI